MIQAAIDFPQISPELFAIDIGGFRFALRWYALAYIAGLIIAWQMVAAFIRRPTLWTNTTPPMSREHPEDLLTWIIIGVILGGRLGYVLFYKPGYYLRHPLEIVEIWSGGMSFHGGFLGVVIAAFLYCRKHKLPMLSVGDAIAVSTPPGLFLGRVANFINGELWGRPTQMPWGVIFPGQLAQDCGQLTELCARHPSQIYEALLEGLLLGAVMLWLALRRGWFKKPGALIGLFVAGYGLGRFIVEFVRQPDEHFVDPINNPLGLAWHIGGVGLTMGQILSLPMIAFGLWMIRRRI